MLIKKHQLPKVCTITNLYKMIILLIFSFLINISANAFETPGFSKREDYVIHMLRYNLWGTGLKNNIGQKKIKAPNKKESKSIKLSDDLMQTIYKENSIVR